MRVRAQRMVKTMGHMSFRATSGATSATSSTSRRPLLTGADRALAGRSLGEGVARQGLPQHGFPYALATATLRPDPKRPDFKVKVLRVDPHAVQPATSAAESAGSPTIVSFVRAGGADGAGVYWDDGAFAAAPEPPSPRASAVALGVPAKAPAAAAARAFAGVQDVDGMLVWLELAPEVSPGADAAAGAAALLESMGCSAPVALFGGARALLGGRLDVGGDAPAEEAAGPDATVVRMVRRTSPGALPRFESTPIVRPSVWQPLQSQRVRYFHRKTKAPPSPTSPEPSAP